MGEHMEAENAWANIEASQVASRYPTQEPHYTKIDTALHNYFMERCIEYEFRENPESGELVRVAVSIPYQDILDAVMARTSHLESVSSLETEQVEVEYARWSLSRHMMEVKYEAIADKEALNLLMQLDNTIYNILNGRAHHGTHQKYDAAVAGARRTLTLERGEQKRGLFRR